MTTIRRRVDQGDPGGRDPPAAVRGTREFDPNPMRKFNNDRPPPYKASQVRTVTVSSFQFVMFLQLLGASPQTPAMGSAPGPRWGLPSLRPLPKLDSSSSKNPAPLLYTIVDSKKCVLRLLARELIVLINCFVCCLFYIFVTL